MILMTEVFLKISSAVPHGIRPCRNDRDRGRIFSIGSRNSAGGQTVASFSAAA